MENHSIAGRNLKSEQISFERIDGVELLPSKVELDSRGYFQRFFSIDLDPLETKSQNFSVCLAHNQKIGTARGLHWQESPFLESKFVTCISGSIFDVIVDVRPESQTFLNWAAIILTPLSNVTLKIPEGVAHGYQTLAMSSQILYGISGNYSPSHSRTLNLLDPNVGVNWPIEISDISEKDRNAPFLNSIFGF